MMTTDEDQRRPVDDDLARRRPMRTSNSAATCSSPSMFEVAVRGSELPVPPPSAFHCARRRRKHLRHDPGDHREVGALHAEDDEPDRDRNERTDQRARAARPAADRSPSRMMSAIERIAAEPDERLLPDRDQPGVAGEQVPALRHGDEQEDQDAGPGSASAARSRARRRGRPRRARAITDERGARGSGGGDRGVRHATPPRGNRPRGRTSDDREEHEVPGKLLPLGVDGRADGLRDAEDDAARQRAPEAAEPADHHGLERIEQPRRARPRDRSWRARP